MKPPKLILTLWEIIFKYNARNKCGDSEEECRKSCSSMSCCKWPCEGVCKCTYAINTTWIANTSTNLKKLSNEDQDNEMNEKKNNYYSLLPGKIQCF